MPSRAELAENTGVYVLERPLYPKVFTDDFTFAAGPHNAWVLQIRRANIDWARAEARRRGIPKVEWWVGWSSPSGIAGELLAAGLVPDDEPVLTGMTCAREPPTAPGIEVRRIETQEQYLAAVEVDWAVWQLPEAEREQRRRVEVERFDEEERVGVAHHWAAFLDGRAVGFGRALDMADGVAMMGGAVLPEARKRGVYRALVHARWEHAAARETPLLVVQAGQMSAPVLDGLGFERHGDIRLFVDRL